MSLNSSHQQQSIYETSKNEIFFIRLTLKLEYLFDVTLDKSLSLMSNFPH